MRGDRLAADRRLYAELERIDPSPVVTVNRAVAVGFADGPRAGLALLDGVAADERLARYQPLHAARAELLRRAGEDAGAAYARAIELNSSWWGCRALGRWGQVAPHGGNEARTLLGRGPARHARQSRARTGLEHRRKAETPWRSARRDHDP